MPFGGHRVFYIITGKDEYRCQQKLLEIKQSLGASEMVDMNTSQFDADDVKFGQIKAACDVPPFLCPDRLVIVRGLFELFESPKEGRELSDRAQKRRDNAIEDWRAIAEYVPTLPGTTLLVLLDGEVNMATNPLAKMLLPFARKSASDFIFGEIKGAELAGWIKKRVTGCGGIIDPGAVKLLTEVVGGDLWALSNEIDKLLTYSAERRITEESVHQNTGYIRDVKIFDLVDAILAHNTFKAQQLLHRSFEEGMAPMYVLSMIIRQFRLVLRAKEMLAQKISEAQIGTELNLRYSFTLQKTIDQSRGYSLPRLNDIYHRLLDTDIALKTSRYAENLAMELLVIELCKK